MSLTVQQLLSDAKRLTGRLRDHDSAADSIINSAQDVLKEVEAMRQYQEDIESLNTIAHNRPRAQLVLGIQQENRHIRQLQHENKELRAALEEHQNVLELIMSKYRQHMSCLVHSTKLEKEVLKQEKSKLLQERADKICEMANVMQKSIQIDDDSLAKEQELLARLITENKGLREMLEISHRSGSYTNPLLGPRLVSASCQTDDIITSTQLELTRDELEDEDEDHSAFNPLLAVSPTSAASLSTAASPTYSTSPRAGSSAASSVIMNGAIQDIAGDTTLNETGNGSSSTSGDASNAENSGTKSPQRPLSSASEEEEESEDTSSFSEDDEISFNTIKRQVPAHAISKEVNTRPTVDVKSSAVKSATPTTAALKTIEATTTTAMAESKVVKSDGDVNCVNGDNNNGLNHDDNGVKSEVTSTPNDEITTTSVVQKTFEATIIEPTSS